MSRKRRLIHQDCLSAPSTTMRKTCIHIFPALVFILASCVSPRPSLVAVRAELIRYEANALHFDLANGTGEWFDSAIVRIASPPDLTGRELTVYFNKGMKRPLGAVGTTSEFSIERQYFDETPHLFYGDLKNLKRQE